MKAQVHAQIAKRRGAVVALFAILLAVFMGMVAFAIDIGYLVHVKTELQRAADAASLAAAGRLLDDEALKGAPDDTDERALARSEAHAIAAANPAGNANLAALDADIKIGYVADPAQPNAMTFNSASNAAHVLLRRDASANGAIPLSFARVMGLDKQDVRAEAIAIYEGGIKGFGAPKNSQNSSLLPYTLKIDDWNNAFTNGADNWKVDPQTGAVTAGADGIREVKLFPGSDNGKKNGVTPGNFGTVDIGNPNNSTSDLARQILDGPNASDFSYFPDSKLQLGQNGTLSLNGDTGISAGVKDELASIKGKPRTIPLYTTVSGNGNNAQFTIVQFVGIRILDVQLTGSLSNKQITIQPSFVVDPTSIRGGVEGSTSSFVRQPLRLIQ